MNRIFFKKIICYFALSMCAVLFFSYGLLLAQIRLPSEPDRIVRYTSQDLPDPFANPFEMQEQQKRIQPLGKVKLPALDVQGLVWGSQMPQAIINNTVVKVGDSIEDVEILDIDQEGISVYYQGQQFMLKPNVLQK